MDDGGTRAVLAKSRRLVLVSRNLVRLMASRIGAAERLTAGVRESMAAQPGRRGTTRRAADSG